MKNFILINADNETVTVNNYNDFKELTNLAGLEKVEIFTSEGGWVWLLDEIEDLFGPVSDENENELIKKYWELPVIYEIKGGLRKVIESETVTIIEKKSTYPIRAGIDARHTYDELWDTNIEDLKNVALCANKNILIQ